MGSYTPANGGENNVRSVRFARSGQSGRLSAYDKEFLVAPVVPRQAPCQLAASFEVAVDQELHPPASRSRHDVRLSEGVEQGGGCHQFPSAAAEELSTPAGQVSSGNSRQAPCQVATQFEFAVDQELYLPALQRWRAIRLPGGSEQGGGSHQLPSDGRVDGSDSPAACGCSGFPGSSGSPTVCGCSGSSGCTGSPAVCIGSGSAGCSDSPTAYMGDGHSTTDSSGISLATAWLIPVGSVWPQNG